MSILAWAVLALAAAGAGIALGRWTAVRRAQAFAAAVQVVVSAIAAGRRGGAHRGAPRRRGRRPATRRGRWPPPVKPPVWRAGSGARGARRERSTPRRRDARGAGARAGGGGGAAEARRRAGAAARGRGGAHPAGGPRRRAGTARRPGASGRGNSRGGTTALREAEIDEARLQASRVRTAPAEELPTRRPASAASGSSASRSAGSPATTSPSGCTPSCPSGRTEAAAATVIGPDERQPAGHRRDRRRDAHAFRAAGRGSARGARRRGAGGGAPGPGPPGARSQAGADARESCGSRADIAATVDKELAALGRRAFADPGDPAGAPRDRQARRPPQLPDELHPKSVEARHRGRLPVRDDGGRARSRREARAACRPHARHRQGAHPRARRLARRDWRRLRAPPRRSRGGGQRHRRPPHRRAVQQPLRLSGRGAPTRCRARGRAPAGRRTTTTWPGIDDLERITRGFRGVAEAFAVQGGREVRVYVEEDRVDDLGAVDLSRAIAAKISAEMRFPGQIRVTVIRELAAVEVAS